MMPVMEKKVIIPNEKFVESAEEYEERIRTLTEKLNLWPEWKKKSMTYVNKTVYDK